MGEVEPGHRCSGVPRRLAAAAAVAIVLGLVAGGLSGAPAGGQAAPSLTVTPSSGLTHGQFATVTGTGFLPDTYAVVLMCPPGITDGWDCDLSWYTSALSDATGSFTTSVLIRRFITGTVAGTPTEFDCAVVACTVAAGDVGQLRTAFTPVDLIDLPPPAPEITTGSVGTNGVVPLTGSGFRPGRTYDLRQCPPGAIDLAPCDLLIQTIITGDDGTVATVVYPRADAISVAGGAPVLHDCRVETCTLHVADGATTVASAALDLSGLPPSVTTLTAAPVTDLVDSTAVEVTGTGYAWGSGGPQLRQCVVVGPAVGCPRGDHLSGIPEVDGTVVFTAVVRRDATVLDAAGELSFVDCAFSACMLLGEESLPGTAVTRRRILPLSFAPLPRPPVDPVVTVTHTGGDGYDVTGTGFPLGGQLGLDVCGAAEGSACSGIGISWVEPDSAGTFSVAATIPRFPDGATGPDCLLGCIIRLFVPGYGRPYATSAPFSSPAPELTVTLDDDGTLDPGTEDAVASATVTCDQPTRVEVEGTITQPGVTGGYSFTDRCSPDEPLLAFIPTRVVPPHDQDLVLGPAEVSVTARSVDGAGSTPVTATGTVTLHDETSVVLMVGAALQDPAEVELRALFLRSLAARVRQDPVFATELYRALFGGG